MTYITGGANGGGMMLVSGQTVEMSSHPGQAGPSGQMNSIYTSIQLDRSVRMWKVNADKVQDIAILLSEYLNAKYSNVVSLFN